MFGAFIVLERNIEQIHLQLGEFRDEPETYVISVSDWYPNSAGIYMSEYLSVGTMITYYSSQPPGPDDKRHFQSTPDGVRNREMLFWSTLMERANTLKSPNIHTSNQGSTFLLLSQVKCIVSA